MKKSNWHGGKGSGRRGTDDKKYADNWDLIFGNKQKDKELKNGDTTSKTTDDKK